MKLLGTHVVLGPEDAAVRVLVFHHAGGSAISYLPLARQLLPDSQTCLFELPGRGIRAGEAPLTDFTTAVKHLLPEVAAVIDRPVFVVGHSLGAILAHSLVCGLPSSQLSLVGAVLISAFTSPDDAARLAAHPSEPFVFRSRGQLLRELVDRGGCPPEIFEEPDLLELTITLMGHDLHLADTYLAPTPLSRDIDYHVWYGRDDAFLDAAEVRRWEASTPKPPTIREFPGGHFYLGQLSDPPIALRRLVAEIANSSHCPGPR
ncbi:MAG: thioesterase II family protein [Pseudonocardiaceae bacterium]